MADGQLQNPAGIAVDSTGNVYVVDADNQNVKKFDDNGKFITKWGSLGTSRGQFENPVGIAVDSDDFVYVTDIGTHDIQKFTSNGTFITAFGSQGTESGFFNVPYGIAIDPNAHNIYVADSRNNRIQVFSPSTSIQLLINEDAS